MTTLRHCAVCNGLHVKGVRCPTARAQTQVLQDLRRGSAHDRGYDSAWQVTSKAVIDRDGGQCRLRLACCTVVATTADHIVALSRGGSRLDMANLQAACRECNAAKRDR